MGSPSRKNRALPGFRSIAAGGELLYASLCRCDWVGGRPSQTTVAYLGRIDEWQAELLRAAYSDPGRRPRVIWDEGDDRMVPCP